MRTLFFSHWIIDKVSPLYPRPNNCWIKLKTYKYYSMNSLQLEKGTTFPKQSITKTIEFIPHEPFSSLKKRILQYFLVTYERYQKLFTIIKSDRSFYTKPEPLRHPLIFYYGHTACVYVNKLLDRGLISARINPSYERMFAVGVDEMDWDDLNDKHYDWPSVKDTFAYRQQVKQIVVDAISKIEEEQIGWDSKLWVVMMGIQHEQIHLQTSSVIMRRLPIDEVSQTEGLPQCPIAQHDIHLIPQNQLVHVPAFSADWDHQRSTTKTYGWDNEFGVHHIQTPQFKAGKMLVSNGQFFEFFKEGGYQQLQFWTDQGKRWLQSTKTSKPLFWILPENTQGKSQGQPQGKSQDYKLRTIQRIIQMPWDWPAQLNNLQARAFCKWKSKKQSRYYRLPTQDEYFSMRFQSMGKLDQYQWQPQSVGNINLQYWISPSPVNLFLSQSGEVKVYDIIGNVWQHTITPIYPFADFKIHPIYEDFSTPTFDQRHDLIKGGSFISTGIQADLNSRWAFRRHFYQFAGIRYVVDAPEMQVEIKGSEGVGDKQVEQILWKMYGEQSGYFINAVQTIRQQIKRPEIIQKGVKLQKCLTVGCSVGRIPLQFGKDFIQSIGIDYTARYFQMSTRLKECSILKMPNFTIKLEDLSLNPENVSFWQMHPENPDPYKINQCTFLLIDASFLREKTLSSVLQKSMALMTDGVWMLAIICERERNQISDEQVRNTLGKHQKIIEKEIGENKSIKIYLKLGK